MATTVSGPITGGRRGRPFAFPVSDLDALGYVGEEFFVEGDAAAYAQKVGTSLGSDGRWSLEVNRHAPFKTRMLVIRPKSPADANGVIHVTWYNVSSGFELGVGENPQIFEGGYTWVGVSAQRVGLEGNPGTEHCALLGWDPDRYGSLHHPGDDYSFDMFTQCARALTPELLGGIRPRKKVAVGGSQSASRLRTYVNGVQPLEREFDAFLLTVDFARAAPLDSAGLVPTDVSSLLRVPTRIRTDTEVPVLVFNSETEVESYAPMRQPDTDMIRLWEVTGTPHAGSSAGAAAMAKIFVRDELIPAESARRPQPVNPNVLTYTPAQRALWVHFHRWLADGTVPPAQPRVKVTEGAEPKIVRDGDGNAIGGIRLPDIAVPTGSHAGSAPGAVGLGSLAGTSILWDRAKLVERYGSREQYLERWSAALDAAIASGVALADDRAELLAAAESSSSARFA